MNSQSCDIAHEFLLFGRKTAKPLRRLNQVCIRPPSRRLSKNNLCSCDSRFNNDSFQCAYKGFRGHHLNACRYVLPTTPTSVGGSVAPSSAACFGGSYSL